MSDANDGFVHTVQQGESTTQLAYELGLFWKTVWEHPENEDLRRKRPKQNILKLGDQLFIPTIRAKEESGATEKRHRFKRKGVPEKLNVRFLNSDGKPYANEPYQLTIDGSTTSGKLDGDGWLRVCIPPNARGGKLEVGQEGALVSTELNLGDLDPIDEISGVKCRLLNLGFYGGPIDDEDSEEFQQAIVDFRKQSGLAEEGGNDDALRRELVEQHGS